MLKCNEMCIKRKEYVCCSMCNHVCDDRCSLIPEECGVLPEGETKVNEVDLFQSKALQVMYEIADIDRQKKLLDAQDAEMRSQLIKAMDEHGIKNFENDILKVTYVLPTTRESIDSKRLKKDLPEIAEKYTKISPVKGSVRITVK